METSIENLYIQQMSPTMLSMLVLLAACTVISGVDGINSTVSPGSVRNSTSLTNLSTTAVPSTQGTTDLPTNATQQNSTPGIKKGECYGFDVFVLNNQLHIPYTVTCCIAVLCGFYLILCGKICVILWNSVNVSNFQLRLS